MTIRGTIALAAGLLALAACGGGGRTTGSSTVTPQGGLASGTALTMVSGETGAPIAGATVNVAGQALTTDSAGQVRLSAPASFGTSIDVLHPAFLDRLSLLRINGTTRFTLWPKTNASGLSEHYSATLVYTATSDPPGPTGESSMSRLPRATTLVAVVPSPELLADGPAMQAHAAAVATITEATGGAVTYALAPTRPASGVIVTTRADPQDSRCLEDNIRGYARTTTSGFEVQSAEIVFCDLGVARSSTVGHELGHTFGLRHSPDANDIMFFQFGNRRSTTFGPRESLVMRLMLDRPPGNRFPDNDRTTTGSSVRGETVTICY